MANLLTQLPQRSIWHGWGDPEAKSVLPGYVWRALKLVRGVEPAAVNTPPVALDDVRLPEPAIDADALEALRSAVGAEHVSTERLDRVEHAGGKSYPDLYRLRAGDGSHAPDAVVFPGTSDEVVAVLRACAAHDVAVVPFGGGTSVVGGVDPVRGRFAAVISLDLRRLNRLLDLDETSMTAVLQPGMRGPEVEAALEPHGLTLGHFPQSFQQATVGGFLVTRSSGQASSGYGRFEENVVAVKLATPEGELSLGGRTPTSATAVGPKLIDVLIGSEGTLGVITEVTMQVHPAPTESEQATWAFPTFEQGLTAFRRLAQELGHGVMPDVSRLSDVEESLIVLAQASTGIPAMGYLGLRGMKHPCLGVFQWEDTDAADLAARRKRAERILKAEGGRKAPSSIAEHWMSHRFRGPYQRDHLMDRGIFVETLETATMWSNIPHLYAKVVEAIHASVGEKAVVQAHVSHLYDGGASLYFTFFSAAETDPLAQWSRVKRTVGDAIAAAGGTISHHHAVGTDHRPWAGEEIGDLGVRILRAVKNELDPSGILNPGKLLPDAGNTPDSAASPGPAERD